MPVESSKEVPTLRRRLAFYLFAAARVLAGAANVPDAARLLLAMIGEADGFCAGVLWQAEGDVLRCVEVWCPPERPAPEFERACRERTVARGAAHAGRVWASGRPLVVADVARDDDARRDPRVLGEAFRSTAIVPVASGADVIGVIELFGTAPRDPDPLLGEVLAAVAGQLAEYVRRSAAEAARARAENRLRTVIGNAPIVLFGFDREGRLTVGEGRALSAAGVRAADVAGRSVFEVYRDVPVILEHARRALAGESFTETVELTHGGQTRVYETRYDPIHDGQGQVVEVIGVATDVTERAVAERALRRSEAQLVEADRLASLGALAAGVAHEINNPLAYVLLNVDQVIRELTSRSDADPSLTDLAARLEEARSGVERVRLIAQDLKAFSRVDHERRVPVDVRRVLDSSVDIAGNEIRHRARLLRQYGPVPLVDADPSRLGQVFLNLLLNAVQAMDDGDPARHEIRVGTELDGTHVVVTIADTGSGIPGEVLPRIFEPFFTTKPAGVGTGLGLAICKSIVTALGGQIRVDSAVGRGTTFRVLLPASSAQKAEPPPPSPRAFGLGSPAASDPGARLTPVSAPRKARVLIVDDEPVLASALGRSIAPEFEAVVLASGRDALELLRRDDGFDVILCDLIMPAVTGMDLHEELCRSRPSLAARMIFMTGGTFTPRTRAFLAQVQNPTLDKPFELAALQALLRARSAKR
jgi:PAS domain S-box-containing protein